MTPTPQRADRPATGETEPLELTSADYAATPAQEEQWLQPAETASPGPAAGGRRVLGVVLSLLAILWVG